MGNGSDCTSCAGVPGYYPHAELGGYIKHMGRKGNASESEAVRQEDGSDAASMTVDESPTGDGVLLLGN